MQILVAQCFSAILSTHLAVQHAAHCQRCLPHNSHTLKCNTWRQRRQRRRRRQQLLRFLRLCLVFLLLFCIPFTFGCAGYYRFVASNNVCSMYGWMHICLPVRLPICRFVCLLVSLSAGLYNNQYLRDYKTQGYQICRQYAL